MPYLPSSIPTQDKETMGRFIALELKKIADSLRLLETQGVNFDTIQVAIDKPREGLVSYSAAGILGTNEGLYRYSSGGAWVYIG